MKKILKSKSYPDEGSFAPIIYLMYYDEDFVVYETRIKLSAEFMQELNAMGILNIQEESDLVDSMEKHYSVLEKNVLSIDNLNIKEIEKEYLDNLNNKITIKRYDDMYLLRLENIKQLKRQKNLRDLGV